MKFQVKAPNIFLCQASWTSAANSAKCFSASAIDEFFHKYITFSKAVLTFHGNKTQLNFVFTNFAARFNFEPKK
ncbi:hypothetical protein DRF60_09315 [Chryseobacterium elymi]|uniref:Uncharacterized protein n=1 Tax=Chryseobacterium elymi TaxID=395936 RepID=A0A3D9DKS5_9FLAO|nr:hypothetical protein DRF60_09315 [Chryseobacterium elymi]